VCVEDGPLGDPAMGERTSVPLPGGNELSTRRDAGIWPHLRVRPSPEVGPGASVGTYRQGYLLLGCPVPWRLTIRNLPLAFWVTWHTVRA
jgi:hypothetical protein